jgi:antitoxin component HigA of HigAB toxin-antitoxin module
MFMGAQCGAFCAPAEGKTRIGSSGKVSEVLNRKCAFSLRLIKRVPQSLEIL